MREISIAGKTEGYIFDEISRILSINSLEQFAVADILKENLDMAMILMDMNAKRKLKFTFLLRVEPTDRLNYPYMQRLRSCGCFCIHFHIKSKMVGQEVSNHYRDILQKVIRDAKNAGFIVGIKIHIDNSLNDSDAEEVCRFLHENSFYIDDLVGYETEDSKPRSINRKIRKHIDAITRCCIKDNIFVLEIARLPLPERSIIISQVLG